MRRAFRWADLAWGFAFVVLASSSDFRLTLSSPLTLVAFLAFLTVVHELGHALASLAVRHRIFEVRIGVGPAVRIPVGTAVVVIGVIPFGGHVVSASPDPRGFRAKRLLIVAAGLALNAILLVLALMVDSPAGAVSHDLALLSGLIIAGNLLPYTVPSSFGPQETDGLSALRLLVSSIDKVAEQLAAYYVAEAHRLAALGDRAAAAAVVQRGLALHPTSTALQTWLATDLLASGRYWEARLVFGEIVERGRREPASVAPHIHALHLNNLAWADLLTEDPALVPEAEEASRAAIEELPQLSAVKGTRAFALIISGSVRDGIDLSLAAYRKEKDPRNRALQACVSAIGYARDWRFAEADRWLGVAGTLDPLCDLLPRASREVSTRRPRPSGIPPSPVAPAP
jgi:tetratricopeptide (TPR) repeat protein